jgi:hypothetical protein
MSAVRFDGEGCAIVCTRMFPVRKQASELAVLQAEKKQSKGAWHNSRDKLSQRRKDEVVASVPNEQRPSRRLPGTTYRYAQHSVKTWAAII